MARRSARADGRRRLVGLACALLAAPAVLFPRVAAPADLPLMTEEARARLLALGPWPAPVPISPAAPAQQAAVALGEQLFHSPRLAEHGAVRCASCHQPWRDYSDGRERALGLSEGDRNTPSLWNVGLHRRFGLDGARDALWRQALRPLADPREMPASAGHVARLLRDDAALADRYAQAFGTAVPADDTQALEGAGRALAAYLSTLRSAPTPFDAWRDALAADPRAPAPSASAWRGALLFVGRGECDRCHAGPAFSDDELHAPFPADTAGGHPQATQAMRTPGLRQVANTAPYMHDGRVVDLCDAVRPHVQGQPQVSLTPTDRTDLVAFLYLLTAPRDESAPAACRPDRDGRPSASP